MSLTPALCATLLKPVTSGHGHARQAGWFNGLFGWFNRGLDAVKGRYAATVGWSLKRTGRLMLIYAALLVGLSWAFIRLPGGFLPVDDQGFITTDVQTPSDSSYAAHRGRGRKGGKISGAARRRRERHVPDRLQLCRPGHEHRAGLHFAEGLVGARRRRIPLPRSSPTSTANYPRSATPKSPRCSRRRSTISAIPRASASACRIVARRATPALTEAADRLIAEANAGDILQKVYVEGLPPAPQVNLAIDREKAGAFGVTFEDINNTISTNLGSNYVNDFPNRGRMQRVIVQADRGHRMNAEDILNYNVKNSRGQLVPFSAFATVEWSKGPTQIAGFNYYPAVRISGEAKPGYTSGDAIAEMERLAGKLPRGFGYEWTGQSLQEKLSGSQAPFLLALSALVVFLCLAALYESWTIPLAVLLTVPLGIFGAVVAATLRGLPNDVYFTVGLITIIGLAAKDAILIIEFARDLRAQGKPLVEATVEACRLAFPPDPDDGCGLCLRRAADGDRARRRRRQPAGARYRRHGRHDRGRDPGAVDGAGVFRERAAGAGAGSGDGRSAATQ